MERATSNSDDVRPIIHMIDSESDEITSLAMRMEERNPKVAELLFEELGRAELHSLNDMPSGIVTMNCKVEFADERSGSQRTVELVYPHNADIEKSRISIFTPIGAGLIGMAEGETIAWPDRSGVEHKLRIVKVTPPKGEQLENTEA